eukprot:GHUV01027602.1.p2 GENE.GHUV01027602.1~~GHUV01027602.1.p2  ORF type:complete len:133 (-),score=22.25 GHUV01027602.1:1449-1847(-)
MVCGSLRPQLYSRAASLSITPTCMPRTSQKAKEHTFTCPVGQLSGRAGRRCTLEDGERILDWCIQERPWDLQPRVILLRNLMKQGLGRERDVPWLAIQALQETGVEECDISSECYVQVLQAVLVSHCFMLLL